VAAEWRESKLLPMSTRNAYFEDILLDSILSVVGETSLNSYADAEKFVDSKLSLWVKIDLSAVAAGCLRKLALKAFLFNNTKSLERDSKLGKLLKIADKSLTLKNPIISQAYEKDTSKLVFCFPNFDEEDEPTLKCVSHIVALGCALHSTKPENVAITRDTAYGEGKLTISSSLSKLIDTFVSSAHHPQGLFLGEVQTTSAGFKGNLVAILAAMRLLNIKGEFIRKRKFPNGSGKSSTSYNTLQETFNLISGLKTDKSMAFALNSVKAILSSCVKTHNKGFPGGWINASRALNGVKTDFAVVNLLGWVEKVPSQHKLLEVLFNTVDSTEDSNKKVTSKLVNITQDKRNFSHREFRTAVALCLPRVFISNRAPEADLKLDPFSVKDLSICNNFCSEKRDILVDRLNESYGFKVSLKNPKSKTKEIHYRMSRDRLLAESANMPLITAEGTKFETFSDLPKPLQKYFRDNFRYPIKRKLDETLDVDQDVPMEEGAVLEPTEESPPLKRKKKYTRGKAATITREGGKAATLAKKAA
jgi:hypothetical protein